MKDEPTDKETFQEIIRLYRVWMQSCKDQDADGLVALGALAAMYIRLEETWPEGSREMAIRFARGLQALRKDIANQEAGSTGSHGLPGQET